jgi:hypothetical protein
MYKVGFELDTPTEEIWIGMALTPNLKEKEQECSKSWIYYFNSTKSSPGGCLREEQSSILYNNHKMYYLSSSRHII